MRIQAACKQTHLTERAIRLYIKEGLLSPKQHNGILDFSEDDLMILRQIGALRQADFSVPQIHEMLLSKNSIPAILREKADQLQTRAGSDQVLLTKLLPLVGSPPHDIASLVRHLYEAPASRTSINLARLDEEIPDEEDIASAWRALDDLKRARIKRAAVILLCIAIFLGLLAALRVAGSRNNPGGSVNDWQIQRQLHTILDTRQ